MNIRALRLSAAQISALQCAGLEVADDDADRAILTASLQMPGGRLVVSATCQMALVRALIDCANSEDAFGQRAERSDRPASRLARGACLALTTLARRVARVQFDG